MKQKTNGGLCWLASKIKGQESVDGIEVGRGVYKYQQKLNKPTKIRPKNKKDSKEPRKPRFKL
jgi:hypothetical protein